MILPTPNEQRTASGAPGNRYWQQRPDYDIKVELDDSEPASDSFRNHHLPEQLAVDRSILIVDNSSLTAYTSLLCLR